MCANFAERSVKVLLLEDEMLECQGRMTDLTAEIGELSQANQKKLFESRGTSGVFFASPDTAFEMLVKKKAKLQEERSKAEKIRQEIQSIRKQLVGERKQWNV